MKFYELITESSNDSYYAYQDAAKKWAKDTGKDPREFSRAGTDVQDEYIEPEMKKHGLVPDKYMGKGVTSYKRESLEAIAKHVKEGTALCDSSFRHGSQAYLETFQYAKKLREAGALPELDWESEEMLATDVGESVKLKNGETVWLDIPYLIEDDDVNDSGMIGEPDAYYDAEERKEAYNQLQDALDSANSHEHDYVVDGICPECGGSSYMDGDYEGDEDSCYGWGNYGCDQGEMEGALWKEIKDSDERRKEKEFLKNQPQPSDDELELAMQQLHKEYVQTGRLNAFELPSVLRQMFPEISKPKAREIGAKFLKSFGESIDQGSSEGEAIVAKMLAKALGDDNRWTEMSAAELYAELESVEPKKADMIALVAKMLYDVKLQERAYKDVGVADVVKDKRGKEFKFDKGSKKFKSVDGEEAAVNTTLGKDLMRIRRNAMKRTSPSYNKEDIDVNEAVKPTSIEDLENLHIRRYYVFEAKEPSDADMLQTSLISEKLPNEPMSDDMISELQDFVEDGFGEYGKDVDNWNYDDSTMVRPGEVAIGVTEMEGGGTVLYTVVEKDAGMSDQLYPATPPRLPYDGESPELHWNPKTNTWSEDAYESVTNEAEYNGKKVKLNKPMRSSGGGKKYKVYVKNPKTGRVKKISFGDAGLKTKSGNKKRAKSFAARHNCEKKNDKMKAGYWACRLPRYGLVKGGKWW